MNPSLNNASQEPVETGLLERLISRYIGYWPLLIFLIIVSLGAARVYLRYTIPTYGISATIMVSDNGPNIAELPGSTGITPKSLLNIDDETVVFSSTSLVADVVRDLHLNTPIYIKGKFFNRSAYNTSPVIIEVANIDSVNKLVAGSFTLNQTRSEIMVDKKAYPINTFFPFYGLSIKFILNPNFNGGTATGVFYFAIKPVKETAQNIQSGIEIAAAGKETSLVLIKYKDEIPGRGIQIINDLIQVYNRRSIAEKTKAATNTLNFVQNRLGIMTGQINGIEHGVEAYKTNEGVVDITQQSSQYLSNLTNNEQKLAELKTQFALLDQIELYLQSVGGDSAMVPSTFGIEDPALPQMLAKLSDLRLQYNRLRKTTAENNPIISSLKNEIDETRPNILELIKSHRRTLLATQETLKQNNNKYSTMLSRIPDKERQLGGITREQLTKNSVYNYLLQKREESELSMISATANSRIVESAVATPFPVNPKPLSVYMLGLAVAMGLMFAFVGVKEILNDRIINRNDVSSLGGMSVVAELTRNRSKEFLIMDGNHKSFLTHQFKQIRAAILNDSGTGKAKKWLITSAGAADGKLFFASNTGISLARSGKRTVLIEMDFYNPRMAGLFRTEDTGLSDYLAGKKTGTEVLHLSPDYENLYIIPAGTLPENAAELLVSSQFYGLLTELDKHFDLILMVSAPLIYSADGYVISRSADRTLFIVRENITRKKDLEALKIEPGISQIKNGSLVYNGARSGKGSKIYEVYG